MISAFRVKLISHKKRGCTKLVSIEGITLSETIVQNFTRSFDTCKSLEYLRWNGGSIKTNLDLSASIKLDRASIANTIIALHCFEKEPTSNDSIWFPEGGNWVLIKLTDVPQNVNNYRAIRMFYPGVDHNGKYNKLGMCQMDFSILDG